MRRGARGEPREKEGENTSASDKAWFEAYVEAATDYLYQHFGVDRPTVILHCEETCPWSNQCRYLACYQPWNGRVSFKSGSEKGYIVAHEFGHHLQNEGVIREGGESGAMTFERWWNSEMNEEACEVCGDPLFVSEDLEPGSEIECETCDSVYEAVPFGQTGGYVVSKNQLMAAVILSPIVGAVFAGFIFDRLPHEGLPKAENISRTRALVGGIAVSGFLGAATYAIVGKETAITA